MIFLVYSQSCATIFIIKFQNDFVTQKKETLCPLAVTPHSSPHPAPGQPTDLLSVSTDLPFGTYYMNYMWVFVTGFFH